MISVTFLKVCCQSDVSFSRRRCGYSGLVYYMSLEALSFEWTMYADACMYVCMYSSKMAARNA